MNTDRPAAPPPRGVFGGSAWSIGRIAGIEINVDHTWVLIFVLITFSFGTQLRDENEAWTAATTWLAAGVTSLLFFASIVLHELGHSLTAQRLGVQVRAITLFVFGGVAQLMSEPKRPGDEVAIAVAGPLVSVALAVAFGALAAGGDGASITSTSFSMLSRINYALAIFNCIPGFPLDGGRVLRGIVWAATGSFERATAIAARSGSMFAYLLMGVGILGGLASGSLLSGLWLVFIGWFLLSAARSSVGQVVIERILASRPAVDLMEPVTATSVVGHTTVSALAHESVLRHGTRTFYVVDAAGALRGLVTLAELAAVPVAERDVTPVESVMVPVERLEAIEPATSGWDALRRMAERGVNQLPVVEGGRIVGSVTRERLLAVIQGSVSLGLDDRAG